MSNSGYQSEQLRERRVTSEERTMPTHPNVTLAVSSLNPSRWEASEPVNPRSESITSTSSARQPSSVARFFRAYCSLRLSRLVSTWCGVDWRT
jgi:hypothetical protein